MENTKDQKKITLARWLIRALAISLSTLSAVAFIKVEFQSGGILAVGWLLIVIAEKRIIEANS